MKEGKRTDGRPSKQKALRPWKILKRRKVLTAKPWFQVSVEQIRLPDGKVVDDYYQMQFINCVIIFAQTEEGKIVMERHYKHGVRKVTLTLPTGGIDSGETPLMAAQRELKEETGYTADDWKCLGQFTQMANYGGSYIYLFMVREARAVAEPQPSDLEEMEIVLMDVQDLMEAIREGSICILNTVTAILMATHPLYDSCRERKISHDSVKGT